MQLIFVHGPIASGKLTIARELAASTGLPLFHNHLVVDAVLSVFAFGSEEFVRLRDQFWLATFEAAARSGRSLIFTFAPEPTVPRDFVSRAVRTVDDCGGEVVFIELRVSQEEQERRVGNPDRRAFQKLSDVGILADLRHQAEYDPTPSRMPPAALTIDTDTSHPAESAALVASTLGLPTVIDLPSLMPTTR